MADFLELLEETHKRDLKLLIDFVPAHTSDQHAWFATSRASKENDRADWYVWVDPCDDGTPRSVRTFACTHSAIASAVVSYVAATRDVETLNEVYRRYDATALEGATVEDEVLTDDLDFAPPFNAAFRWAPRVRRTGVVASSGSWPPNASRRRRSGTVAMASVEQAKQIGRPHLLQLSKVLRSGWR